MANHKKNKVNEVEGEESKADKKVILIKNIIKNRLFIGHLRLASEESAEIRKADLKHPQIKRALELGMAKIIGD